ncbi:parB-like nuclease domain protein [Acinetobacter baumannii 146457]|nr:parB-like nuclease domain protein [Acinetobacter baumannii 146457]
MNKIDNISNDSDALTAIDAMISKLGKQVITEWDGEKASKTYQEYLSNLDQYDGKLLSASKAYFNDHLNGKVVQTKIGLVRINSRSRGKVHDRMRDVKYLAIPYIPDVLMTGEVGDLVPLNKDREDSAVGYYHFTKGINLKDFTLNITLKVALDADGNLLYFLGAAKEKANLRSISHAQGTTDSKAGFDSIESYEDEEINIIVQVLDKEGNALTEEEAEALLWGDNQKVGPKIVKGRTNNVKTAKGTKVSTIFAVVESDQVIVSHTASGSENPNYPQELQPRDRSREASQAWVQKTSNTLDPESLGRSGRADTGAPIIGDDLVVESGNGRTMAIQLAYERGSADEYKQWLIDEAEYFGFSFEQLESFKQPILVRIRTSEVDRAQFTVEANQDDKLSFTATERAKSDAKRLDENLISLFAPGDDGDLLTVGNQKFVQSFLKSIGETEAAQYISTDGKPTQALVTRIKAAIFSKAYNDDRLLEMMADQSKPDLQNMLNALSVAAPKFIEAQAASRGNVQEVSSAIVDSIEQSLDKRVANAIIDAANTIMAAKSNDQDIVEFVKQQGLFGDLGEGVAELAVFLAKNSRSAKKMSLLFKAMAQFAEKQAIDGQNMGLFGEPEPVSIKDAINYAVTIIEENYGENTNLSMFDSIWNDNTWFDHLFEGYNRLTEFDKKAHEAATSSLNSLDSPTQEQKLTGEYQKGRFSIGDLKIAIENPAGSTRSGVDPEGKEWKIKLSHHYGFIENTTGADGDEIDVFVKNHLAQEPEFAYIISQINSDGSFDEQKVILGADTEEEAQAIYMSNYAEGWQGFGGIKKISMKDLLTKIQHTWSEFDSWAMDGNYEHIPVDKINIENAPKIHESKISKEDPIVVIEKHGKYFLVAGKDRLALAKQRGEKFIPAIIFDDKDVKTSIIQKAIKQAGSLVDPVALAALIIDELDKSLMKDFDDASIAYLDVLYQSK